MMDDIGREQFPQLGAPWVGDGSASFSGSSLGNNYEVQVAGDFPNLNTMLANGINFTGMWSSSWCKASREMLRVGWPGFGSLGTTTTKSHIQAATGSAYKIYHYGKNTMGEEDGSDEDFPFPAESQAVALGGGYGWSDNGTYTLPVSDTELWTLDGEQVMFNDEIGFIEAMDFINDFYNVSPGDSNWFQHMTGQPFMLTISTYAAHGQGGTDCVHNRTATNGYVYPTSDQTSSVTNLPLPTVTPSPPPGPTPNYNSTSNPTYAALSAGANRDWWKIWYDCQRTQLEFVDDYLGKIISWLGPHGLKNTYIIFTGDNGTTSDQIALRTNLIRPASTSITAEPTDDVIDITGASSTASTTAAGKATITETGLNVPFVVAYGGIPQNLRNTTSKARLNFADVAETIAQLVKSNSAGYFSGGRNFKSLLDGTAGSADTLFGSTVGVDHSQLTGVTRDEPTQVSAVLDPDADGDIYRVLRWPGENSANCDYVQNLGSAQWWENLRDDTSSEVVQARADLDAAIEAAFPGAYPEDSGCL